MQRLVEYFGRLVKLNPNYFAFLSGLSVSISINLLTDLVFGKPEPSLVYLERLVLIAFLISSINFAILASSLEKPHQHWVLHWRDTEAHHGLLESEVINGAVRDKLLNLALAFMLGSIFSFIGIVLLFYSAAKPH
jgi:hypothetical protein